MSYLSRKDIDELKPLVDKAIYKILGTNDSFLLNKSLDYLEANYDRRKTVDKLSAYVDSKKASRLTDKLFDILDDLRYKSKKRSYDDREESRKRGKTNERDTIRNRDHDKEKEKNVDKEKEKDEKKLSSSEIQTMMDKAQRQIEERKRSLDSTTKKSAAASIANIQIPPSSIYGIPMGLLNRGDADKARKIAALQAQIKTKLSSGILANAIVQSVPVPDKPTPLILDDEGRTVDRTGKTVQLTHVAPTLKANIRAQKKEQYKSAGSYKHNDDSNETKFFDLRIGVKPAMRTKRALRFHEPGKFTQLAERLRMKAQLEKLQNEISQIAKKTGISSATKLALIAKSEGLTEDIPEMEWWDSVILEEDLYTMKGEKIAIKENVINSLVEHPTQMRCPSESNFVNFLINLVVIW